MVVCHQEEVVLVLDDEESGLEGVAVELPEHRDARRRPGAARRAQAHNAGPEFRGLIGSKKERASPGLSSSPARSTTHSERNSLSGPASTQNNNHNHSVSPVPSTQTDELAPGPSPQMLDLEVPCAETAGNGPTENADEASTAASGSAAPENNDDVEEKQEMTPQETARHKRHYVLMELVETEKDYVKDLASVVEGYVANCEASLPEDLVGKDKIIFANIAQIQEFHANSFLKEIEKSMTDYNAAGRAFVKYERRLENLYVKYCQNKPKSDYLVAQEQFEQFFAETKLKLGHKVALCDLLIKPVQRIMKYQLLLKDILKFTERAADDTKELKKALQVMHVVPKACDDMMQVGRLQNFDGNLSAQGKLMYQGTLAISESLGGKLDKPKDRRIFLFEQSAIVADHIPPKKEFGNPTYIFRSQIMVNKMMLEANVADDPLKFIIKMDEKKAGASANNVDCGPQPAFIALSQTPEEKAQWIAAISAQLDQQKTLLAALVDPKRYQSQLAGNMANLGLEDKKGGASSAPVVSGSANAFGKFGATGAKGAPGKVDSPRHGSASSAKDQGKPKSGGLFGFGKKAQTKSPTSPPPTSKKLDVTAASEQSKEPLSAGPDWLLSAILSDARAGEYDSLGILSNPLAEPFGAMMTPRPIVPTGRPFVIKSLEDQIVAEGARLVFEAEFYSPTALSALWRGPAVEQGDALVTGLGTSTKMVVESSLRSHSGQYSIIAENELGSTSTEAIHRKACKLKKTGRDSIRLSWQYQPHCQYSVEYTREGAPLYRCARSGITKPSVTLRNFRPMRYLIRVVPSNLCCRGPPSESLVLDFSEESQESLPIFEASFVFSELLGCGRTAFVFEAKKLAGSSRKYAAKVYAARRNSNDVAREAEILSQLTHPSLPNFEGTFRSDRGLVIVVERVPGVDIVSFICQLGYLSEGILQQISRQIFSALAYLQQLGIVHLDVKPDNILVDNRATLIDFGCAQQVNAADCSWSDGDPQFRSPDEKLGPPSNAADLW
ncbi:unnamed protein product, partial [Mesorhabditis spiculigera]